MRFGAFQVPLFHNFRLLVPSMSVTENKRGYYIITKFCVTCFMIFDHYIDGRLAVISTLCFISSHSTEHSSSFSNLFVSEGTIQTVRLPCIIKLHPLAWHPLCLPFAGPRHDSTANAPYITPYVPSPAFCSGKLLYFIFLLLFIVRPRFLLNCKLLFF